MDISCSPDLCTDRVHHPVSLLGLGILLIVPMLLAGCHEDDTSSGLKLGSTPPPAPGSTSPLPTVSLTANPTNVNSGGFSALTWSSTGANSCNAAGAWSGSKPLSGSQSVGPLTQTSTFTLTCSGPSGNTNRPVTVAVTGSTALLLTWAPNLDPIGGYITYFGQSADTANAQLSVIPLTAFGFDPQAPGIAYDVTADLGLSPGDMACFRLKAYNAAGSSGLSGAACVII